MPCLEQIISSKLRWNSWNENRYDTSHNSIHAIHIHRWHSEWKIEMHKNLIFFLFNDNINLFSTKKEDNEEDLNEYNELFFFVQQAGN